MNLLGRLKRRYFKGNDEWSKQASIYSQGDLSQYYSKWLATQANGSTPLSEEMPWISFEAIDLLNGFIESHMRVFEYGSGGSSVFFARRANHVTSIEHDPTWFGSVKAAMEDKGLLNWDGHCVTAEPGVIGQGRPEDPKDYVSSDFGDRNFKKYASSIDGHADETFDLVLVDGRARPSCLIHALPKIKAGGLLVLDNADRSYYTALTEGSISGECDPILDRPGPFPFVPQFLKTTIWMKRATS